MNESKPKHTYVIPKSSLNEDEDGFPKVKDKNRDTFVKIFFKYLKKHLIIGVVLFITVAITAAISFVTPKIIQNLTTVLMGGGMEKLITGPNTNFPNGITPDAWNSMVQHMGINLPYMNYNHEFYTKMFGFDMTWQLWSILQGVLIIVLGVFTYISNYIGGLIGRGIEIDLRNKTLEKLVKLDMSYYSDKKIGDILTRIISDTQIVGTEAQEIPVAFLSAIITFFGSLGILFSVDWKLTLVVLVDVVVVMGILFGSFPAVRKLMFGVRKVITNINGDVTDRISTIRLIKASGTENYEIERFREIHKEYYKKSRIQISAQTFLITVLIVGISSIQTAIMIAAAIIYHGNSTNIASILTAFISGVGTMIASIMQTVRTVGGLVQATTSAARIYQINKSISKIDPHFGENDGVIIDNITGDITFKNVDFAYPEKPEQFILKDFTFNFKQGKMYAFVGETGVGKSTISKLLLRFYDPTNGQILINNKIDLKDIHLSSYLDKVGYVEQDPQILFGTVFDNVRYSRFEASNEEVIEACKKAELHDLIMTWPDGYDTILGERGFMLSGGQKQRLVIARMFLKDPQILILDEATSALDNIVEKEIQSNLEKLMKNRTTISIAHRLSTIKNADQIIVLAKNEGVSQIGTFDELKTKEGHFKKLYNAGLMD